MLLHLLLLLVLLIRLGVVPAVLQAAPVVVELKAHSVWQW